MYISHRKKINGGAIGYTYCKHKYVINLDSFSYNIHQSRRIGHDKAVELAKGL